MTVVKAESQEISRQLSSFEQSITKAEKSLSDQRIAKDAPQAIESQLEAIKLLAEGNQAQELVERLEKDYLASKESNDTSRMQQILLELKSTTEILRSQYRVRIVNRKGVKSGIDRIFTDTSGSRVSGYYLVLEAVDRSGNLVSRNIRNSETGSTESVKMWGEEVPREVYEFVKNDKLDNGIIDQDLFSLKSSGYLSEEIVFPTLKANDQTNKERNRITSW